MTVHESPARSFLRAESVIPITLLLVVLLVALSGRTSTRAVPIERALWVTRWDYTTAEEVERIIDRASAGGFDTVFFQVRGNATAFYPSELEPWAEEFEFRDPGFDPLGVACARAAARGIALHAWINAIPGWRGLEPPTEPNQLYHTRPEWFLVDQHGRRQALREDYVALNPCHPDVRAHIVRVCEDLVRRYPVAGIHLDYIRFLADMEEPGHDYPHDPMTLARYQADGGGNPAEEPARWDRWRRDQVTRLVREIDDALDGVRPGALLTAAVFPTPEIAYGSVRQDWVRWLRHGWIDAAVPMIYDDQDDRFESRLRACVAAAGRRPVIAGIGVFKHADPDQTRRQTVIARRLGADGVSYFGYASFYEAGEAGAQGANEPLRAARRRALLE